jgi:DNA-binding LacI/PurR family transcriptional regulator
VSDKQAVVKLRTVADRVGLAACSVSAILNNTPASMAIPQRTKDRVLRAAAELNYRPNLWARSLRSKRTYLIAAVTPDIGFAPVARIMAGVQSLLHRKGYLLAVGSFDSRSGWHKTSVELQQRGIEGIVAIGADLPRELQVPVASVDLDSMALLDPLADDLRMWLAELGESAAETVVRQIEKPAVPRRIRIAPKLASAYFGLSSVGLRDGADSGDGV